MALVNQDLFIEAGATFNGLGFDIKNDNGTVYDLTGYTASLQIRKTAGASTVAASVTPTLTVASGGIDFTIPASVTSTLTDSPYVWAVEVRAASGDPVIRVAEGRVIVSAEVVR